MVDAGVKQARRATPGLVLGVIAGSYQSLGSKAIEDGSRERRFGRPGPRPLVAGPGHPVIAERLELAGGQPGGQSLAPLVRAEHHGVRPGCPFQQVEQGVDGRVGLGGDEDALAPGEGVAGDGDHRVRLARAGSTGDQRDGVATATDDGLLLDRG